MHTLEEDKEFIAALLDVQPESVIWYTPIWSGEDTGNRTIIDFELRYCNDEVSKILGVSKEQLAGQTVMTTPILDDVARKAFFEQYLQVWTTGERQVVNYYYAPLDRHLESVRTKVKGGVISITRDRTKEVRAEQELLSQERTYQQVINTARDGVLVMKPVRDEQGQIIDFLIAFANDYALTVGDLPKDCVGKTLLSLLPHVKENGQFDLHKEVMEKGEAVRYETSFRTQVGDQYGWFIVSLTRIENAIVSRFTDITANKRNEQQIIEQRNLLQGILDASQSAVFTCKAVRDEKGFIQDMLVIKANHTFTQVVGKSTEEVEGKTFLSLFPTTKEVGVFYDYCKVIETGERFQTEMYYKGEGIDGWFEVAAVQFGNDGVVVSFTDVTEEKQFKEELEKAADYMQQMIDVAPTSIFTMTPVRDHQGEVIDFRFTRVNRTMAAYSNRQPDDFIGGLHGQWFPAYRSNGLFDIYKQIADTGEERRFDFNYLDGNIDVWLDVTAKKMGGDILVSFHDYTALKKLQLQLETTVEELQQSNQNLEEFAYAASHDLQAPLRKIHTFAGRLRKELSTHLSESQQELFTRIERATQNMRTLIEDLLAYSEVGAKESVIKPVSLNNVVEHVLHDLENSIQETGAVVQKDSLPEINGDERQLRQLFQNLIGNAIKYRRPEKKPVVSLQCRIVPSTDPGLYAFREKQKGDYYLIEVSDNGIGFAQEDAGRIFQVFQRLHGRAEYEGTGVGLAIVQKVVDNHKGYISAEGRPGEGATFRVFLPT